MSDVNLTKVVERYLSEDRVESTTTSNNNVDPDVQLSLDLRNRYDTKDRKNWVENALENDQFRNNIQWKSEHIAELERRLQAPIVVNVIKGAVDQAVAMLTSNSPRFQATAREDSDADTANLMSDIMSYVHQISNGDMHTKVAIDDNYVKGMGAMLAYSDPFADYGKGEVFIKSINPLDLYLPPSCKSPYAEDADSIIIRTLMTKAQLYNAYPDKIKQIDKAAQYFASHDRPTTDRYAVHGQVVDEAAQDEGTEIFEVLERYTKIRLDQWHVLDTTTQHERVFNQKQYDEFLTLPALILQPVNQQNQPQFITKPKEVVQLIQIAEAGGGMFHYMQDEQGNPTIMPGPEHEGAIPESTIVVQQLTMADLIEMAIIITDKTPVTRVYRVLSVGDELIFKGAMPIEHYPLVTFMNRHNRNPYPMSDVWFVKDIQEYINKLRSLVILHATNITNQKLLLPRGSSINRKDIEKDFSSAGSGVIYVEPDEKGKISYGLIAPPPLPNELYKNIEDAKLEIQEILGIFPLMQGDARSAPATFKGTVALDEFGQRRIRSKRDDIEGSLNQMAKVVIQLVQATYGEDKVIRLFQPNNKPKTVTVNASTYDTYSGDLIDRINDVSLGNADVIVVSGSTMPSNRWARLDYYMELYEKGILRDDETILRETDIRDIDEVLARSSAIAQLSAENESLKQKVKEQEGDIQTRERELFHSKQETEIEKFKNKLGQKGADHTADLKITKARTEDLLTKLKSDMATSSQVGKE